MIYRASLNIKRPEKKTMLLLGDTHIGHTSPDSFEQLLKRVQKEQISLIVYTGDFSSAPPGCNGVEQVLSLIRKVFPETPIVSTIGNSDLWCGTKDLGDFDEDNKLFARNMKLIKEAFHKHKAHFLDEDGVFLTPRLRLIGMSGWYAADHDKLGASRDLLYIPSVEMFQAMSRRTNAQLKKIIKKGEGNGHVTVFVSHFPVMPNIHMPDNISTDMSFYEEARRSYLLEDALVDQTGACEPFGWEVSVAKLLIERCAVSRFLSGHTHRLATGPFRYDAGGDFESPQGLLIDY